MEVMAASRSSSTILTSSPAETNQETNFILLIENREEEMKGGETPTLRGFELSAIH